MFLKELGKTRKRVQKSVCADELILKREHHKQAGIFCNMKKKPGSTKRAGEFKFSSCFQDRPSQSPFLHYVVRKF